MSIEQKLFQIQSMSNIIKCIDKRFAIKNLGISRLALTFSLNIPKMKTLHIQLEHSKNEDPAGDFIKLA